MAQEEKNLLLKDLCTRLFYGVKGLITVHKTMDENSTFNSVIDGKLYDRFANLQDSWYDNIPSIKPYLRPMSSMTKDEREEWADLFNSELDKLMSIEDEKQAEDLAPNYFASSHSASVDWLNKKMFDYRGLIKEGLALEATEGMYKS